MIEQLIGKRFNSIWCAADMLCLDVGDEIHIEDADVAEFSLHIQCPWRFVRESEILLASRDMYEPADPGAPDSWYDEHADGRVDEATLLVSGLPAFHKKMAGCGVSAAFVSPLGDLKIEFSNGVRFETFAPCSRKGEFWRVIDFRTGVHFIAFDA